MITRTITITEATLSLTLLPRCGIQILLKIGNEMKEYTHKMIQTITAIIVAGIVVSGIYYAQPVCCSTAVNDCTPTALRISVSHNTNNTCEISPVHGPKSQLPCHLFSKDSLLDFDSEITCCKTDYCDSYTPAVYLTISFIRDVSPLQKGLTTVGADNGEQAIFGRHFRSTSPKSVPIYILTQSIIC